MTESEKLANRLTLEKASLMGFLDAVIDELPKPYRRDFYRQKIATSKLITPMGWCDELPYPTVDNSTNNK